MKLKVITSEWVFLLLFTVSVNAQPTTLPSVDIYSLDGNRVDASTISNDSMPMILVFFKTYDNKCCDNLFSICEAHEEILSKRGVKMMAVCIDCIGKIEHVKPFVFGHGLEIDVYVDKNGDLKRTMGIPEGPYTILYDQNMNVYCQHSGYCVGNQEIVCKKVNECLDKMGAEQ
jgi:hypothetical protein